jgi:3-oxoacyl-[acyl-carrier protein] reductase
MTTNKTAIVTGASRGIGGKTAELLCAKGFNVLINYNKSREKAGSLKERIVSAGGKAEIYKADVSVYRETKNMTEYCLERFGSIDVLVNNAGISRAKEFSQITPVEWERMIKVNLTGVYNCTHSVLDHMLGKKRGKIINVSSVWGIIGGSCEVHYSAAKAGVIGFTKALAKELGPSNIQVNCVAPGIIHTDMLSGYTPGELSEMEQEIPLGRLGSTEDVARVILFLTSDEAGYITGQVISPNGGYLI